MILKDLEGLGDRMDKMLAYILMGIGSAAVTSMWSTLSTFERIGGATLIGLTVLAVVCEAVIILRTGKCA